MGQLAQTRYLTGDELDSAAEELVRGAPPGLCRIRRAGSSREGRPLTALSVGPSGDGHRNVLVVAGAHPNEPVGGLTALRLARRVTGDPGLRSRTVWHFLLCADPDGAHRHRSPGPRGLLDYHRHFFRPAGPEQPEWAPSLLSPADLPPESTALLALIDELRPFLQCSLHATELGGSWVQLTRALPGLAEPFAKSAAGLGIPVETSASDAAHWESPGPGIYVMPSPPADGRERVPDEAEHSTWHRAHRYGGMTAVVEVPMWASDVVEDTGPHPDPRGALVALAARLRGDREIISGLLDQARPFTVTGRDGPPLLRAVEWTLALMPGVADGWAGEGSRPATEAYVAAIDAFGRRLSLRTAAMLARVLGGSRTGERLTSLVTEWCEAFAERFDPRWVPIDDQVELQARTVVSAFDALTSQAPSVRRP
ncbi:M14 family zinc carboxypeptidase [Streptomyces sp. GC420]|uniref:M14 family zinc carboxypeptidase n=1 Tax=Streptomyces sp. GC420 TaxID=2697568 RepID=UPI001415107D|nr:M14 family zinc carboxypeptidase [Streptomyces sp. GC420]NBM16840.1 3-hydroxyacyl-CoA dehydrogenase [Streptomyces sp. GC420]